MSRSRLRAAFSMVELMIVVAIIADIALIAVPSFIRARKTAQNTRFANDLRVISSSIELFSSEFNRFPDESPLGVVPTGILPYLKRDVFGERNTIGGGWDWDFDQGYARAAICTQGFDGDFDVLQMGEIDKRIDDGVISTGSFRQRTANRYAYIIEP